MLGCTLAALTCVAAASSAYAFTIPYTFSPVAGSPFKLGASWFALRQVLFSPNGSQLASLPIGGIMDVQSVSKAGAIGAGSNAAGGPGECRPPKEAPLGGRAESMAYSPTGALLATAFENSLPETGGSLRIYSASGATFPSDSYRSLPSGTVVFPMTVGVAYATAFSATGLLAVTDAVTDTVSIFTVTSAGKATPVAGSPLPNGAFATGKEPDAVTFGPTRSGGEALAVANHGDNTVSTFSVYGTTVAPAPESPSPAGSGPSSVAISPGGLLAVADEEAPAVSMFSVDYVGQPKAVSGSPVAVSSDARSVAFDPTGTLLGVAGGSDLRAFSVSSAGALSELSSSPLTPGAGLASVAFSPDGFLLATANQSSYSWLAYSYGESLAVLPPWLTSRLGTVLESAGLGLAKARILPLIGHALEQLDFGGARANATVRLLSSSVLPGRLVAGRCVGVTQGSVGDPRCVRRIRVPVLTLVAHSRVKSLRVVGRRRIKPGTHSLWVTATAAGASATPQALQVSVVG